MLGVDPGTRSFDVAVVEGGRVVAEVSIDTEAVARDPLTLLRVVDELEPDYVVGPSGYGVPVTRGDEVLDPRRFAVEVLLLSTEEQVEEGTRSGELGVWVYGALARVVEHLVGRLGSRTIFIPAVVHLQTVPWYRKLNRVDMGTADKLATAALAVHTYSYAEGVDYARVNAVVAEVGYGYSAALAIKGGRVVDGVGGTAASAGTLTAGALDLEVVAQVGRWGRWDVFRGGVFHGAGTYELEPLAKAFERGEEPHASLFKALVEGVAKDVARALVSTPKAEVVLLSGRYGRDPVLRRLLQELLEDLEVRPVEPLRGASRSKEAAQGYAALGEGLLGGYFRDLVEHLGVREACGTAVDYLTHPRAASLRERVLRSYVETVRNPKLCRSGSHLV